MKTTPRLAQKTHEKHEKGNPIGVTEVARLWPEPLSSKMNNLHIAIALHEPGKNHEAVVATIRSLGGCVKIHETFWFVKTTSSAEQVAKAVWAVMDPSDSIYVADPTNNTAFWFNIPPASASYMQENWNR